MGALLALFLGCAAADILGKELGRWGVEGAVRTRWPSLVLACLLGIVAVLLNPWVSMLMGIAFSAAFAIYRARHIRAWNIIGVDMRKVSRIGDAFTALHGRLRGALRVTRRSIAAHDPLEVLASFLKDDVDWRIRRCAAEAIGEWEATRSIDYLQQGLHDKHWRVQLECVRRLVGATETWSDAGAVSRSEVARTLEGFLGTTESRHPRVRRAAVEGVLHLRQRLS